MAVPLPDPALVERFRRDLAAVAGAEGRLAIAVSGGPDSLALLLLAAAARRGETEAATVDHGLRAESGAEAEFVARTCAALGVPHRILRVTVPAGGAGVQAEARAARYDALGAWMEQRGLSILLTGHHADDQAETLLMRLQRGSGVGGLAGVRAGGTVPGSDGKLALARPLLGWRRTELAAIVTEAGVEAVDDPSNADADHQRVRMRRQMAQTPWLDIDAIARSAAALAEADEALDRAASRLFVKRWSPPLLDPTEVPSELLRRVVTRCLRTVAPDAAPRGEQVTALLGNLARGETTTLAGVRCSGGPRWRFEPAPPRR
jgi:tRNA(Ile)-lysidine synthase